MAKTKKKAKKKATRVEKETPVFGIRIENNKSTEYTRDPNPDDEWDSGVTQTYHSVRGFRVVPSTEYYDLLVPYEPQYGESYYLLYVIYSTGDSFGHSADGCIQYIDMYTREQAEVARENLVMLSTGNTKDKYSIKLRTPDGKKTYECHAGWEGYFESLTTIELEIVERLP